MKIKINWYLLFLFFCFLCIGNISNLCHIFNNFGSDNQALIFWKYTASIGLLPYRDVFYPYGYMTYYLGQNIIFSSIYLLIAPVLFLLISLLINKIFKNIYFTLISILLFYIYVLTHTGFEFYSRYGLLVGMLIIFIFVEYKQIIKSKLVTIELGVLSGILFILSNDVSFYVFILFILYSSVLFVIRNKFNFNLKKIINFVIRIAFYISGYFIGLIPFLIFLYKTHSLSGFLFYLHSLGAIAGFAKTPFLHSILTADNIFTLVILMLGIIYNCYYLIYKENKLTFHTYTSIGLIIVILLLEQKSIIRSIDRQITFVAFLLMIILFADIRDYVKKYTINDFYIFGYFFILLISVVFIIGLRPADQFINQFPSYNSIQLMQQRLTNVSCLTINYSSYLKESKTFSLVNSIKTTPTFNGKIYSFPSDAVLYGILRQTPPYYPSLYESTTPDAQKKIIKYIQVNEINIIVLNNKIQSIQDTVPDKVRGKLVLQFINNYFSEINKIGDYTILVRIKN